ncbi:ArdC-like ssDNA-binding domain-containing protein [Burkholderia sp. MBR-1]|uniref:ArdC-like ssDNA-binding domain-containing protein n=1 Tax=Burkholderia sp. MBR-1 TaxID=2732364 RepID=UPI0015EF56BD|nr:ArdC family protein [Burkholderia sp. MBR-1]QMI49792.1 DUF1738 domain-containing protein [Burkholderia sp. MBR-1]
MAIRTNAPRARKTRATANNSASGTGGALPTRREKCNEALATGAGWLAGRSALPSHPWAGLDRLPQKLAKGGGSYEGTNCIILWAAQDTMGFRSPVWGGFKAIKDAGFKLEKGSHHTVAIFGGFIEKDVKSGDSDPVADAVSDEPEQNPKQRIQTLQPVQVFNLAQTTGFLSDRRPSPAGPALEEHLARWKRAQIIAAVAFQRWETAQTAHDLVEHEIAMIIRLAGDFAVTRALGHAEVIEEPLPLFGAGAIPQRLLKICGVAQELSAAVERAVFGGSSAHAVGADESLPEGAASVSSRQTDPTSGDPGTEPSSDPDVLEIAEQDLGRLIPRSAPAAHASDDDVLDGSWAD